MGPLYRILSIDDLEARGDYISKRSFTHRGIMAGKLNGVIPAVTPSGALCVTVSMSLAMLVSVSPSCREVMLQACSTTSAKL